MTDITSFPNLNNVTKTPNITFSTLEYNFTKSYSNFSILSALRIYSSQLESVMYNNFTVSSLIFGFNNSKEISPNSQQILITFIFDNFYYSLRTYFNYVVDAINNDLTTIINNSKFMFKLMLIFEGFIFFLILSFLFQIVRIFYKLHNCIIALFSIPNKDFISNYLKNISLMKKKFKNFKNDEKYIELISQASEWNLSRRSIGSAKNMTDKRETKSRFSFGNEPPSFKEINIIDKNSKGSLNSHSIHKLIDIDKNSNNNVRNDDYIQNQSPHIINDIGSYKETNEVLITKIKVEDKVNLENQNNDIKVFSYIKGKDLLIYIQKYIQFLLFFMSFSYLLVYQLILYPNIFTNVNEFMYNRLILNEKISSNIMLLNTLNRMLTSNSTISDSSTNDLFLLYNNVFQENDAVFLNRILNSNSMYYRTIKSKIMTYYSDKFCDTFYNNSYNYNLIQLNDSRKNCMNIFHNGAQIYLFYSRQIINGVYNNLTNQNPKLNTIDLLLGWLSNKNLDLISINYGYYIRGFFNDLIVSYQEGFNNMIWFMNLFCYILFSVFIVHLTLWLIILGTKFFKELYFYFEKLRILISLFPKKYSKHIGIKKFLNNYY